jgi:hypothetical protein
MPIDTKPKIAATFLSFPGCKTCFRRPCERLRFGRVFPNKFIFVHRRNLGFGDKGCPFVVTSFDEVIPLLRNISLLDLIRYVNDILYEMSPAEQMQTMMRHYVEEYADFNGRVRFLLALWDNNVLGVVRVPQFFTMDKNLSKWLLANESLNFQLQNDIQEQPDDRAATTDSMAGRQETQATSEKPPVKKDSFHIRLNIDPNDKDSQDDAFTLFSTDNAKSYNKVLTVKDDQVPGDSCTDLTFTNLDTSLSYSLKIDLGNGGKSSLFFENTPFGELHG